MIDLHCHILPFIDDGPATWDESMAVARLLAEEGISLVAATPHSYGKATPGKVRELVSECQNRIDAEGLTLELLPGTEILYGENVVQRIEAGELQFYGDTKALLLETSAFAHPLEIEDSILKLIESGYRVVFAHPEKLKSVAEDPDVLLPLVQHGALMQITASNFVGFHGEQKQRLCRLLIDKGLGHFIASDAHGASGNRVPAMRQAYEEATKIFGSSANDLFNTVPMTIVNASPSAGLFSIPESPLT